MQFKVFFYNHDTNHEMIIWCLY